MCIEKGGIIPPFIYSCTDNSNYFSDFLDAFDAKEVLDEVVERLAVAQNKDYVENSDPTALNQTDKPFSFTEQRQHRDD